LTQLSEVCGVAKQASVASYATMHGSTLVVNITSEQRLSETTIIFGRSDPSGRKFI
jgi:hypothetical protein